jgi:FkbM family methyltransferase
VEWIARWIRPGMTVVDVGANTGLFTRGFREAVGPSGTVLAIEPIADLAPILRKAGASEVLSVAVGDHPDVVTLYLGAHAAHSSLYRASVSDHHASVTVPLARLDDLVATCDAIKIDAQGAEASILAGAPRLLHEVRPVWYLEVWDKGLTHAGSSVEALFALFQQAGYRPDDGTWEGLTALAHQHVGDSSIDVCVVPQERAA